MAKTTKSTITKDTWKQNKVEQEAAQPFCDVVTLYDIAIGPGSIARVEDEGTGLLLTHSLFTGPVCLAIPSVDVRDVSAVTYTESTVPFDCDFTTVVKKKLALADPTVTLYSREAVRKLTKVSSFIDQRENPLFFDCTWGTDPSKNLILTPTGDGEGASAISIDWASPFFSEVFKAYWGAPKESELDLFVDGYIEKKKGGKVEITDPLVEVLLKHTYVCILYYVYADVIDYKDFDQSLTPDSDVRHKNLFLGDWAPRYDKFSDDSIDDATSEDHVYIPTSVPLTDALASSIASDEKGELHTSPAFVIVDGEEGEETVERRKFFYGPSTFAAGRKSSADSEIEPITVPKSGNIYLNGRIFSATIDEIWEAIKRIEFGRDSDDEISRTHASDVGYPLGTGDLHSSEDTRPSPAHRFDLGQERTGDPLKIDYDTKSRPFYFSVKSYVNDPNKVVCRLAPSVKDVWPEGKEAAESTETPSVRALSLRELEGLLRGGLFNIDSLARFVKQYAVKTTEDGQGGLWQLEKDRKEWEGETPSENVFLSAAGTWRTVTEGFKLDVIDEEF